MKKLGAFTLISILLGSVMSASATSAAAVTPKRDLPRLQQLAPPLSVQSHQKSTDLLKMYDAALKNLDTQFIAADDGTVYVSTGDIKAEWLRDSSVQTRPYVMFAKSNPEAAKLVKDVVLRQARSMVRDPYANAFYQNYKVHEQKFEIDSLINPILLAWTYWKHTGDSSIFTDEVMNGFKIGLKTLILEQDHAANSKYYHPHLSKKPFKKNGMIWSGFRPSDDACYFAFNIPSNAMAVQGMKALAEIASLRNDPATSYSAAKLGNEVLEAIKRHGRARTKDGEVVYAFEIDGLGNAIVVDDANLPNLMSLPYYGFLDESDSIYQVTRARILSPKNIYFYSGKFLTGVGSPHTPKDMVWPLGLLSQALTSSLTGDFDFALQNLINSNHGSTGLHESVHINDPSRFTRSDFGWPNAMFVEMALNRWNGMEELPKVPKSM